ncbi:MULTISPECIES: cadherin-like domain-containing protein [Sphingobium]|nr:MULTISPECIES: cadherin-like domain-containing protein [Sphingobium]WDA35994.1 cadherin-like domain-containing protein [Sphingobium sp. YC-XJ3]
MANSTTSVNTTSMYNTPQAVDDFYSVSEGNATHILTFDVMANDLGGNAKSLYSITDQTDSGAVNYNTSQLITKDTPGGAWEPTERGGSIRINNGKLEYLVSSSLQASIDHLGVGETIVDRVTYTIQLANGTLSVAEATITFVGTNDAPVISLASGDSAATSLDETNSGLSKAGTLTVTDVDTSDKISSVVSGVTVNGPSGGLSNDALKAMLTLSPSSALEANSGDHNNLGWNFNSGTQAFNFLAAGETLTLTYGVQVSDGHGGTDSTNITIIIHGTNDAPVLTAPAATLAPGTEDTGYTISATDLLAGFTDVDGDTLAISGLTADHGTLADNGDGTWTFSPAANYNGLVSLSYNVVDGHGGSTAATQDFVLDAVNDAPALTGMAATLAHGTEDTGYTISATDLLAGFSDVDGDTLAISGLTADHGTLADNGDGTWTFSPAANYNGPVSLSYSVVDGHGGSTAATQGFVLDAVADPALIGGVDTGSVTEDAALTTAQGQLTLSDPDGPTSFTSTSQSGTYGNFSMGSDGLWTYALLNGDADTNALNNGDHPTETFVVQSADGTSHNVVITVNGHSDFAYVAPTIFTGTGDPNDNDSETVTGANAQTGSSGPDTLTGSVNNDKIAGGAGNDIINAGDGNDSQLYGQAGNDTLNGGTGADKLWGGSGDDLLYGYQAPAASSSALDGADDIYGGSGNDQIFGQNSADLIVGGFGADLLTGGTGADTFRYLDVRDTGDTITDFSQAQGDRIDLTALYTAGVNGGVLIFDDALSAAGAVAEGHVGYVYDAGTNVTTVYVGVNAAYGADLEIKLNGNIDLAAGDFLL